MEHQPGVADRMFAALANAGINIQMITTSEIKISALVQRDEAVNSLRAVHEAFALHEGPSDLPSRPSRSTLQRPPQDVLDVVARLQGVDMEELTIDDISLDETQGRVTIHGVSDQPGVAERVFREIAAADILVDMIVQSFGRNGEATMSFTVPQNCVQPAMEIVRGMNDSFSWDDVTSSPAVAKLSVSGIGLRSHTGVAIRMFRALAQENINVEMINTSEVRVNVVVDGAKGPAAKKSLQTVFADVLR